MTNQSPSTKNKQTNQTSEKKYVITYDNGSGYREYASMPQKSEQAAWDAANLQPGDQYFPGSDPMIEEI